MTKYTLREIVDFMDNPELDNLKKHHCTVLSSVCPLSGLTKVE